MGHPRRKKSAREHQAAVELASKRRQLSKLLKKEGFEPVPLDKKPKLLDEENEQAKGETSSKPKSKEEQEKERAEKLDVRKKRSAKLLKRTSKGQPVMRNLVSDLVSKLAKDS